MNHSLSATTLSVNFSSNEAVFDAQHLMGPTVRQRKHETLLSLQPKSLISAPPEWNTSAQLDRPVHMERKAGSMRQNHVYQSINPVINHRAEVLPTQAKESVYVGRTLGKSQLDQSLVMPREMRERVVEKVPTMGTRVEIPVHPEKLGDKEGWNVSTVVGEEEAGKRKPKRFC